MDMYLSGKIYAKKLSLKILKNAKTASIFCFSCSERLTLQHINVRFTLSQLTWSDLSKSVEY